jgi:hypothetical protein
MFVTYFTDKLSGSLVAAFKPTGTKHSAMVTMLFYNIVYFCKTNTEC